MDTDELLLKLMLQYRPHLRPYAQRLATWELVLQRYNSAANTNYRQSRTLRKKFERLRHLYTHDRSKLTDRQCEFLDPLVLSIGGSKPELEPLSDDVSSEVALSPASATTSMISRSVTHSPIGSQVIISDMANEYSGMSSVESPPPPLDTITIGRPAGAQDNERDDKPITKGRDKQTNNDARSPTGSIRDVCSLLQQLRQEVQDIHMENRLFQAQVLRRLEHLESTAQTRQPV